MTRFVCIHGHFYQPPRENPWLEAVEAQDSARPWHDWNERITRECYAPNAAARILGEGDRVEDVRNNYARMSFNFGPTLLSWLEEHAPVVYASILAADRESAARFGGHGSAIAQAYNHMILPLANRRDRITQIRWGLADFRHRFHRDAEGFWLPETAADRESLELLAEHGIRFTILAPEQAHRVRPRRGGRWKTVDGGTIDPKRAYRAHLRRGRELALYFFDGPVSRAISFEGLLEDGRRLAARILDIFTDDGGSAQLAHVATDGETFGHHHRFGEMALAFALRELERREDVEITNYGAFLEAHPPESEVEIHAPSSWSCAHGVDRWRRDCGCRGGAGGEAWTQAWREPLRAALDALRDAVAGPFEEAGRKVLADPWAARDDYVRVVLDRSPGSREAFLEEHATRGRGGPERVQALRLLEMQRAAMLMYTSCGWFFDDLAGLETIQVLRYAGRVVELARRALGQDLEEELLQHLDEATSNVASEGSGREVWRRHVQPARVDLSRVAGHVALTSLFEDPGDATRVYGFEVSRRRHEVHTAGTARLVIGSALVGSSWTGESRGFEYAALHMGDHHVSGAVRAAEEGTAPGAGAGVPDGVAPPPEVARAGVDVVARELLAAFRRGDLPAVQQGMDRHFGSERVTLRTVFRDARRRILDGILARAIDEIEADHRRAYDRHAPLMRFLAGLSISQPDALRAVATHAMTSRLRGALERERPVPDEVRGLLDECREGGVALDREAILHVLERLLATRAAELTRHPGDPTVVRRLAEVVALSRAMPFPVDLGAVQIAVFRLLHGDAPTPERATETEASFPGVGVEGSRAGGSTDRLRRLALDLGLASDRSP